MVKCKFSIDYEGDFNDVFSCNENPLSSGFCKVHDEDYSRNHKDEIREIFEKKFLEAKRTRTPLWCMGWHIPHVQMHGELNIPVYFKNTVFTEGMNFHGVDFKVADFTNVVFEDHVTFNATKFFENTSFQNTTFQAQADFSGTTFHKTAEFRNAVFENEADFNSSDFQQDANFGRINDFLDINSTVSFNGMTHFSNCHFNKVTFEGSDFKGLVFFDGTIFHYNAEFGGSTFHNVANFYRTEFFKETRFSDFKKSPRISHCKFEEMTDFSSNFEEGFEIENCKFNESVFFDAKVMGIAKFTGNRISSDVYFNTTIFEKEFDIVGNHFFGSSDFSKCIFDKVDFSHNIFEKNSRWSNIIFHKAVNFSNTQFRDTVLFSETKFSDKAEFHSVIFKNPQNILFDKINLENISFLNSDITRVRFGDNVIWGEEYKIFDERNIDKLEEISIEGIASEYRNLRENYEFRLRYEEAGKFFVREMELKRNYSEIFTDNSRTSKQKNWFNRNFSFAGAYFHLSKYGESYQRPLGLLILLIILPTFYFWLNEITNLESEEWNKILPSLESSFTRTLSVVSPFFNLQENTIIDYILRILLIPILGMMFISLRRKLERRFRH